MKPSENLSRLGIVLAPPAGPFGAYVPARRAGSLIYVAGQLPMRDGTLIASGPVPSSCPLEQARQAARQCAVNGVAAAAGLVGGVDRLVGVVRVGAFVASDDSFTQQPQVANAASELLLEIFGDSGRHVRAAVGVNVLPLGASVEIEFIFEAVA